MKFEDSAGSGTLSACHVDRICKAFKIPIADDYLQVRSPQCRVKIICQKF